MFLALDGPSSQIKLSVTTSVVTEVKAGTYALEERQVVTIQPLDSNIYLYYSDNSGTPTTQTVSTNGFLLYRNGLYTIEAKSSQELYILASDSTTNVVIAERA